jgi:signal transduction histidine kinase
MSSARGLLRLAVAAAGVWAGVASVVLAREHPDLSIAGDAFLASTVQLAAGWGLIVAGLAHAARRPAGRSGGLLVAAGFAWFALEAPNPELESSLFFTVGLVVAPLLPALVVHAALAHAGGRLASRLELAVVGLGYAVCGGVAGLLTTALNDPAAHGCLDCPQNLLYLGGSAATADDAMRLALRLTLAWAILATAVIVWREVRASVALRRLATPVLVPAAVYAGLVAAANAHGIERGFLSNDPTDRALWAGQALALVALAAGTAWDRVRSVRMRSELADLVVDLGAASAGHGVRDALARSLGEPEVTLVYRSVTGEDFIDAEGRPVPAPATEATTALGDVAVVGHRRGVLQDPRLVREIAQAALPALEHERLQAQLKAQLAELRASRARIVEAGDAERRRLERDLHDGAQQRIVALALDLRLARRQLMRVTPAFDDDLAAVEDDLRRAVAELRDVAHGLHPHTLQESGLAAALLALAEDDTRLAITALPEERADTAAEFAAYQVVAETLRRVADGEVEVRAERSDDRLVIEVQADRAPGSLVFLEDRVGALDGRLEVTPDGGRTTLRAELPCGS